MTALSEEAPASLDEALDLLRTEQDNNLLLQESIAELQLAADDAGWIQMSMMAQHAFSREGLRRITENCRLMTIANPLIRRGVNLGIAYVWGQGVSITARSASDEDGGQDVNAVVQGFLDDKSNKASFSSSQAQQKNERALKTDGNRFFALFTNPRTGRVQVRTPRFDEIQDIVPNPEDADEPWYYLRQWSTRDVVTSAAGPGRSTMVNQTRRAYYPALGYRPKDRPTAIGGIPVNWDAPMLHIKVNEMDDWPFGIGDVYAALPWARSYKDFLTDWAKLVKALSKYAYRFSGDKSVTAKRTAAKVAAASKRAGTATGQKSEAGATFISGPGGNLEAIPKTGATIDAESGKPLAGMAASAMGVPVTMLLADPGQTGARAVAETLDRPTELENGLRRQLWTDTIGRVLEYVIDQAVIAVDGALNGDVVVDADGRESVVLDGDVDRSVDITWPEMSETPVDILMKAITEADATGKMPPLVTLRLMLEALGVSDIDEVLNDATDDEGNWIDPDTTAGGVATKAFRAGQDPAEALA